MTGLLAIYILFHILQNCVCLDEVFSVRLVIKACISLAFNPGHIGCRKSKRSLGRVLSGKGNRFLGQV